MNTNEKQFIFIIVHLQTVLWSNNGNVNNQQYNFSDNNKFNVSNRSLLLSIVNIN